jgi:copper homeostasis protein CutC
MNVTNIVLEDMVLQANEGLDMTEGSNITLKNIQLITKNTNPVMNIHNSKDIVLNKIGYKNGAELLLNITGDKTKGLLLKETDATKAKKKVEFGYGAGENSLLPTASK